MTLSLLSTPIKTINGLLSNVNAGRSQLPFTFQRKDFTEFGNFVNSFNGFANLFSNSGVDYSNDIKVGDVIFCSYPEYFGLHTVVNVAWNGTETRIAIDTPYVGSGSGAPNYLNNLTTRENYKVAIEIFDESATTKLIDRTFLFSPKPDGSLFVDLAEIVTEYQEQFFVASLLFTVQYSETWTDAPTDVVIYDIISSTSSGSDQNSNLDSSYGDIRTLFPIGELCFLTTNYVGYAEVSNTALFTSGQTRVPFLTSVVGGSGAGTLQLASNRVVQFTEPIQSIYAMKQLLDVGGSNMWETLPRIGGSTNNFVFPNEVKATNLFGGSAWDFLKSDFLQCTISGIGGSTQYLTTTKTVPPVPRAIAKGTRFNLSYLVRHRVTNYVAGGNVLWQIQTVRDNSIVELIGSVTIDTITGDIGYSNRSGTVLLTATTEDADYLIIRVARVAGVNATSVVDCRQELGGYIKIEATPPANLLTKFNNPIKWLTWNRTIAGLIDQKIASRLGDTIVWFRLNPADINKNLIGSLLQEKQYNGTQIASFTMKEPYQDNAKYLRVRMTNASRTENVSEQVFFELRNECNNPIMVEWLNSFGAFEQHLFSVNQTFRIEVEQGLTGERAINQDMENVNRTKVRVPLTWTQQMIVEAEQLTFDQLNALREIKESSLVRAWLTKDGTEQIYVVLNNNYSTDYETGDGSFGITLQFEFPDNFDFFKAKKY